MNNKLKKSKNNQIENIENEAYYGIVPLLHKERIYGFWDVLLVTGAWAIATWAYVHGGQIAQVLGLKQALSSTFFGMALAGLFISLVVIITTRYGIDIWIYQRALLGYLGLIIFAVIMLATQLGYDVINTEVFASSMIKVIGSSGIQLSESWTPWIATICALLGAWIAIRGPIAVRNATRIMVPMLILIGVIILVTVFTKFSITELLEIRPLYSDEYGGTRENYMVVTEWNIAFIFGWFASMGIVSRLAKSEQGSYWGHFGGFTFIMASFISIGVLTALAMLAATGTESVDPTDWLLELGGPVLGILSLIFISVANITTVAVSLYGIAISTKVLKPELKFKYVTLFWTGWIILLIFWGGIWDYYHVFLALLGATAGPIVTLILVDFFLIRKRKISLKDLYKINGRNAYYYTKGINIPAVVSFVLGIIGYLYVYEPLEGVPRSDIFLFTTGTGFGMLVSGLSYYTLSLIPPINRYLRQDHSTEINEELEKKSKKSV